MRIADILYFAPGVRFDQVDLNGPAPPNQYRARMTGFYVDLSFDEYRQHGTTTAAFYIGSRSGQFGRLILDRQLWQIAGSDQRILEGLTQFGFSSSATGS